MVLYASGRFVTLPIMVRIIEKKYKKTPKKLLYRIVQKMEAIMVGGGYFL